LNDEELQTLIGKITVTSSNEVLAALETVAQRLRDFEGRALTFSQLEAQAPHSDQTIEARAQMDEVRPTVYAAIDAERMMRDEIREL
jgi:hypothetical protein